VNANIAGLPAISLPAGVADDDGVALPVGVHLQAPAFAETTLFRAAAAVESLAR
jgi:aspartyl-tRNA(Asn)/glutamyl-tRNA(Gln) amidotransferase subunit A